MPAHLARLCEGELLTAEQEKALFRQMNFLKYRANRLRSHLDPEHPDRPAIEETEDLLRAALQTRDQLIQANMRLVMSIARKFVTPQNSFDDLLSEGTIALMNAVEKFDYERGFRFSTYAYRAISRGIYRTVAGRQKELSELTSFDAQVADALQDTSRSDVVDHVEERRRQLLTQFVNRLDRRERLIVRSRFALGPHRKKRTCRELGQRLGISKERVRQLEQRAIGKIKDMAAEELNVDFTPAKE